MTSTYDHHVIDSSKEEFNVHDHQVSGHDATKENFSGMLSYRGRILKQLQNGNRGQRELEFYQKVNQSRDDLHVSLSCFLPRFFGTALLQHETLGPTNYLQLEDITHTMKRPCVMDIKMGTQTYEPSASPEKQQSEIAKYQHQATLGFRIQGIKVYDLQQQEYRTYDKYFGRQLEPHQVTQGLSYFFHNGKDIRLPLVLLTIEKLQNLLEWFQVNTVYQCIASSLLFAYDQENTTIDVRLIDFAHILSNSTGTTRDEGFILGIQNLIHSLNQLTDSKMQ